VHHSVVHSVVHFASESVFLFPPLTTQLLKIAVTIMYAFVRVYSVRIGKYLPIR
jgi:hypothetical protein